MTEINQDRVIEIGELILIVLYGGSQSSVSLDTLRYTTFASKVSSATTHLQVHSLPPTCAAARFHSQRTYLQVQLWSGNQVLKPEDWGWKLKDSYLLPVTTNMPPAPPGLLSIIRCGCKTGCGTKTCTCRKNGLECSSACRECKGQSCSNAEQFDIV